MTKFEKVNKALMEATKDTSNYLRITKNVFANQKGKYALQNVVTNNILLQSYNTLDEIIEEFNLDIK